MCQSHCADCCRIITPLTVCCCTALSEGVEDEADKTARRKSMAALVHPLTQSCLGCSIVFHASHLDWIGMLIGVVISGVSPSPAHHLCLNFSVSTSLAHHLCLNLSVSTSLCLNFSGSPSLLHHLCLNFAVSQPYCRSLQCRHCECTKSRAGARHQMKRHLTNQSIFVTHG